MKKIFFISVLLLLNAVVVNAQLFTLFGKEIGFVYAGPKVGTVFSKMSNFDESAFPGAAKPSVSFRTGLQLGFVGKFSLTPKFSIQPEITFYQKGVKTEDAAGESKIKTGYIGIPVIAKYALAKIGVVKLHIEGGAYSNIRTGGEQEYTLAVNGQTSTSPLNNAGWRRMDYGFALGGGFEYEQEKGIWVFDFRYDQSIVDAHKSDSVFNSNKSIGISISYLFDFVDFYKRMKEKKKKPTV